MFKLWLPEKKLRTKKAAVPGLDEEIALNLVILKGIKALDMCSEDLVAVWDTQCPLPENELNGWLGTAKIFDIKYMPLSEFARYRHFATDYYYDEEVTKTLKTFRKHLGTLFDGIVDGEIITAIFFTAEQDLLDTINGTATETTCS